MDPLLYLVMYIMGKKALLECLNYVNSAIMPKRLRNYMYDLTISIYIIYHFSFSFFSLSLFLQQIDTTKCTSYN